MEKIYIQNGAKENVLKAYFYMEKLWEDFSSIGLDIGKNENYSALQELIVSQIMENYSNGEDNFLDELSKLAEEKNIQEFLIKYGEL